jgi:hypothetical protein
VVVFEKVDVGMERWSVSRAWQRQATSARIRQGAGAALTKWSDRNRIQLTQASNRYPSSQSMTAIGPQGAHRKPTVLPLSAAQ